MSEEFQATEWEISVATALIETAEKMGITPEALLNQLVVLVNDSVNRITSEWN